MGFENLASPLELPNGSFLKNRIAKAAMSENLADFYHGPVEAHLELYKRWSNGGAGLVLTGNMMISHQALAEPGVIVVENQDHIEKLKKWAEAPHTLVLALARTHLTVFKQEWVAKTFDNTVPLKN